MYLKENATFIRLSNLASVGEQMPVDSVLYVHYQQIEITFT
ncbi:hypothetical protein [Nostoc sp.]